MDEKGQHGRERGTCDRPPGTFVVGDVVRIRPEQRRDWLRYAGLMGEVVGFGRGGRLRVRWEGHISACAMPAEWFEEIE